MKRFLFFALALSSLACSFGVAERAGAADSCCGCEYGIPCACQICQCDCTYAAAYKRSIHSGEPLVVFVRCTPRPVKGCQVTRRDDLAGVACILVGMPSADRTHMLRVADLHCETNAQDVRATAARFRHLTVAPPRIIYSQPAAPVYYAAPAACRT